MMPILFTFPMTIFSYCLSVICFGHKSVNLTKCQFSCFHREFGSQVSASSREHHFTAKHHFAHRKLHQKFVHSVKTKNKWPTELPINPVTPVKSCNTSLGYFKVKCSYVTPLYNSFYSFCTCVLDLLGGSCSHTMQKINWIF